MTIKAIAFKDGCISSSIVSASYSFPASLWTDQSGTSLSVYDNYSYTWTGLVYGGNRFVAVSNAGYAAYSTNGRSWTEQYSGGTSTPWIGLAYGAGKFVSLSRWGTAGVSTNGATWNSYGIGVAGSEWTGIAYGGPTGSEVFVAIDSFNGKSAYSSNGSAWTAGGNLPLETNYCWKDICYGDGRFVAIGENNSRFMVIATSVDGKAWTHSYSIHRYPEKIIYGNGTFIANSYFNSAIASSIDGITWNEPGLPTGYNGAGVLCFGDGRFIALNYDRFLTSSDNSSWVSYALPYGAGFSLAAYGGGIWVGLAPSEGKALSSP